MSSKVKAFLFLMAIIMIASIGLIIFNAVKPQIKLSQLDNLKDKHKAALIKQIIALEDSLHSLKGNLRSQNQYADTAYVHYEFISASYHTEEGCEDRHLNVTLLESYWDKNGVNRNNRMTLSRELEYGDWHYPDVHYSSGFAVSDDTALELFLESIYSQQKSVYWGAIKEGSRYQPNSDSIQVNPIKIPVKDFDDTFYSRDRSDILD